MRSVAGWQIKLLLILVAFVGTVSRADEAASTTPLVWFAVEITVGPGWDSNIASNEQAYFKEHSEHLATLRKAGYIVVGARYSDVGLLVFRVPSADDVRALMDDDPSMQAGTLQYEVYPMNVFYPGLVGDLK